MEKTHIKIINASSRREKNVDRPRSGQPNTAVLVERDYSILICRSKSKFDFLDTRHTLCALFRQEGAQHSESHCLETELNSLARMKRLEEDKEIRLLLEREREKKEGKSTVEIHPHNSALRFFYLFHSISFPSIHCSVSLCVWRKTESESVVLLSI